MKKLHITIAIIVSFCCQIEGQVTHDIFNLKISPENYLTIIPYTEISNKMIVEAEINNQKYKFIFDTGTTLPILRKEVCDKLNLEMMDSFELDDHFGAASFTEFAFIPEFKLGDMIFTDFPVISVTDNLILECFEVDGLIGNNIFMNSVVQISSENKTITITNKPENFVLKESDATDMGIAQENGLPFVKVNFIGAKNDTISAYLLFDTGMDDMLSVPTGFFDENIKELGLFDIITEITGNNTVGFFGLQEAENHLYYLNTPTLNIGNVNINNVQLSTDEGNAARLGQKIFKYGLVTLDYFNMKFYFESFTNKSIEAKEKNWPIIITFKNDALIVGAIMNDELEKQLKIGDKVMQIDGINLENLSLCDIIKGVAKSKNDEAVFKFEDKDTGEIKSLKLSKIYFTE